MNVLIVDDESHARENLRIRLSDIDPEVNILALAESVSSARNVLNQNKVDLVFLDIEMPDENGFALLEGLDTIDFEVIFVTAYSEYALRAFKHLAIAYIVKPIDNKLLTNAYLKVKGAIKPSFNSDVLRSLTEQLSKSVPLQKLAIPVESGLDMVDTSEIITLEASEGYTIIKLEGGNKIVSSKRLKYFEEYLNEAQFLRIHRSYIVNKSFIKSYHKKGFISLHNGEELNVSRNYRSMVLNKLKYHN